MKKFLFYNILFIIFSYPFQTFPQLLFQENFDYQTGLLDTVSGSNWDKYSTGTKHIKVEEGNLSYPGYVSSSVGNYIYMEGVSSVQHLQRRFKTIYNNDVYVSFLLNVRDTFILDPLHSTFFSFIDGYGNPKNYLGIRKSINSGNFNLGINKNFGEIVFCSEDIPVSETVLIVIKYKINSGSNNDTMSLWINPPLSDIEPVPDLKNANGGDNYGVQGILLRPAFNSGNLYLDGIRVSTEWSQAPLPIQLSSFTAINKDNSILLKWKTETEIDNYGFDIERKITSSYKNEDWRKIGFIRGSGNSNVPNEYTFNDYDIYNFTNNSYRLKQLDTHGSYEYSDEINIEIDKPALFNLKQNYPNPFNPETILEFSIPEDGDIVISLYNILGQKVKEILKNFYKAGDYKIKITSAGLSAGVYLCVIQSGKEQESVKMVVNK